MVLYHGSNTEITAIDLSKCRPFKDFGQGFYLTDLPGQAMRMAMRVSRIFKGSPVVTSFDFDIDEARDEGLAIKTFEAPDREWARFVMRNRDMAVAQPCHDFDIVIGPVADDTISRLLRMYVERFISEEQMLRELTFSEVTSQYLFHTERAIRLLKKL